MTEKEILEKLRKEIDLRSPDDFESIERKIKNKNNFFPIVFKVISATAAAILLPVITVNLTKNMNPLDKSKNQLAQMTTVESSNTTSTTFSESVIYTDATVTTPPVDTSAVTTQIPTVTTFTQLPSSVVETIETVETIKTEVSSDISSNNIPEDITVPLSSSASQSTNSISSVTSEKPVTITVRPVTTTKITTIKTTTPPTIATKPGTSLTYPIPVTTKKTTVPTIIQSTAEPDITDPLVPEETVLVTTKPSLAETDIATNPQITTVPATSEFPVQSAFPDTPAILPPGAPGMLPPPTTTALPVITVPCTSPTSISAIISPSDQPIVGITPPISSFSVYRISSDNSSAGESNNTSNDISSSPSSNILDTYQFSDGKNLYTIYFVSQYRVKVKFENVTKIYTVQEILSSRMISIKELCKNGLPAMITSIS